MKTYKQKVKELFLKANNTCEDCGGDGVIEGNDTGTARYPKLDVKVCKTCKGKGYNVPLEFGCEVLISNGFNGTKKKIAKRFNGNKVQTLYENTYIELIENLGKPITLASILWLLSLVYEHDIKITFDGNCINVYEIKSMKNFLSPKEYLFSMPLDQEPEKWNEEIWQKIYKLIKK